MKICISFPVFRFESELAGDPWLSGHVPIKEPWVDLDSTDQRLFRLLALTYNVRHTYVSPNVTFSKAEIASSRWLQPMCRSILRLTEKDQERILDMVSGCQARSLGPGLLPVRLLDRLSLGSVKIDPQNISAVDDALLDYVAGSVVVSVFSKQCLTGSEFGPVISTKTGLPFPDVKRLMPPPICGPAVIDETMWFGKLDNGADYMQPIGPLCFEGDVLETLPDLSRTIEPLEANDFPSWIVSSRTREVVETHGIKGWKWRPVLVRDSELHRTHVEMWKPVLDALLRNPKNQFT
jgi:hypothetical protein